MSDLSSTLSSTIDELTQSLHAVSNDFIVTYDLDDVEFYGTLSLFNEHADSYCPVYTYEINEKCTAEILDKYLSAGGAVKVSSTSDLTWIKSQALFLYYQSQLLEDKEKIIKILFLKEIENNQDDFKEYGLKEINDAINYCIYHRPYTVYEIKDYLEQKNSDRSKNRSKKK